jgi:hypothetical protein
MQAHPLASRHGSLENGCEKEILQSDYDRSEVSQDGRREKGHAAMALTWNFAGSKAYLFMA